MEGKWVKTVDVWDVLFVLSFGWLVYMVGDAFGVKAAVTALSLFFFSVALLRTWVIKPKKDNL